VLAFDRTSPKQAAKSSGEGGLSRLFGSVWCATPEKFNGMVKYIVYDDRGSLSIAPDEVHFAGRKMNLSVRKVVAVSLARQQVPWPLYAIVNLVFLALLVAERWDGLSAGFLIAGDIFGLSIALTTKWVRVDYQDESSTRRSVYFADGSRLGWGGILGGTKDLYGAILDHSRVG
jgi:hypothetical protein